MIAAHPPVRPARLRESLETELTTRAMGGTLSLRVASRPEDGARAERDLDRVASRVEAWARRLTRFSSSSDLSTVNADPAAPAVVLRPTLAAVLSHAQAMAVRTEGTVDVALLDERMMAETGSGTSPRRRSWWDLERLGRDWLMTRDGPVRLDLDGVAKGWIADRALRLLDAYPRALVDADGDVAVRASRRDGWRIAVGHPTEDGTELAGLAVPTGWRPLAFGVATSGTSVHRWSGPQGRRHHLIDPATGRPALTDVVQATVVAESAALAECLAKSAVIRGSHEGLGLLERAGAWAAVLVLERDEVVSLPGTSRWLV